MFVSLFVSMVDENTNVLPYSKFPIDCVIEAAQMKHEFTSGCT